MQQVRDYNAGLAATRARTRRRTIRERVATYPWVMIFILFQILCQVSMLVSFIGARRVIVRSAAYLISLALLFIVPGRSQRHPAMPWVVAAMVIVGLELLNPGSTIPLASFAQWALYLSTLAPLFWATRQSLNIAALRRVILILWYFHAVSSLFGVLQVQYPGSFVISVSSVNAMNEAGLEALKITTATGERVFRPMGLSDTPGGAAFAGFYVVVIGTLLVLNERRVRQTIIYGAGMLIGLTAIYLSHVRATLIVTAICVVVFIGVSAYRRPSARVAKLIVLIALLTIGSLSWALYIGGEDTYQRIASLAEASPGQVYYTNRGTALEETLTGQLPLYPLGAGLGRWGMVSGYFGAGSLSEVGKYDLWAEIQWTAWLFDGGVPLIIVYVGAILAAIWTAWKIAMVRQRPGEESMWIWGALLVAYNMGVVALSFDAPDFSSQIGMEFWVLNGALFAVYKNWVRRYRAAPVVLTSGSERRTLGVAA